MFNAVSPGYNTKQREFEVILEKRQSLVIDKTYINGGLLLKKTLCHNSLQRICKKGYWRKVFEHNRRITDLRYKRYISGKYNKLSYRG